MEAMQVQVLPPAMPVTIFGRGTQGFGAWPRTTGCGAGRNRALDARKVRSRVLAVGVKDD